MSAPRQERPPLLHACVARGAVVLADASADDEGAQLGEATQAILAKIPPNSSRLTYAHQETLFHYAKDGPTDLVVLVVADDSVGRRMPFSFLAELQKEFLASYTSEQIADAPAHGMASFNAKLAALMDRFAHSHASDPIRQAQSEIADTRNVLVENIEAVLNRGERMSVLVDKTNDLSHQARAFRKRSTMLKRKHWFRNVRLMALTGFTVVILFYLLAASTCGASLSHCSS